MPATSFLSFLYIATAIFGVGVLVIDFLGLLGGQQEDSGTQDAPFDPGGDEGGDDAGADDADTSSDQADVAAAHADSDEDTSDQNQTAPVGSTSFDTRGVLVLAGLRHLRSLVYFCVGFGPIGLLALWKGYWAPVSILWSVPAGLGSVFVVRRILRFQTKDTDSSLRPEDLLMRKATVLVSLSKGSMGKVRVEVGMGESEQYALPEHDEERFEKGEVVYVANVGDECVYVESEMRFKEGRLS
jgi:membrane protein implicated in regulation of membrane protease activity